uniref:Uncharacterized protein n=1 Tax=Timema bartmani TaxID=61472 RepID=A0A7R9EZ13_9NEOP|nr:unnamed protein product [Timema bartmani]
MVVAAWINGGMQGRSIKVSKDPYNYTAHIELITTCQTVGDLLELRQSRENMSKLFPLTPELWLSWLKDEASLADSDPASKQAVIELFERAVGDYLFKTKDKGLDLTMLSITSCHNYSSQFSPD